MSYPNSRFKIPWTMLTPLHTGDEDRNTEMRPQWELRLTCVTRGQRLPILDAGTTLKCCQICYISRIVRRVASVNY